MGFKYKVGQIVKVTRPCTLASKDFTYNQEIVIREQVKSGLGKNWYRFFLQTDGWKLVTEAHLDKLVDKNCIKVY